MVKLEAGNFVVLLFWPIKTKHSKLSNIIKLKMDFTFTQNLWIYDLKTFSSSSSPMKQNHIRFNFFDDKSCISSQFQGAILRLPTLELLRIIYRRTTSIASQIFSPKIFLIFRNVTTTMWRRRHLSSVTIIKFTQRKMFGWKDAQALFLF